MTTDKNISDILRSFPQRKERIIMSRSVIALSAGMLAAIIVGAPALVVPAAAAAPMSDAEKAAMADATAKCRAQVKEQAQFHEMSLYARHKAVKKCVKDMLASH